MKKLFLLTGLMILFASAAMAQDEKCFSFEGGGFTDEIRLTVSGSSVKGVLSVSRTNSEMPTRTYEFTGTISKGQFTLRFSGGTPTAFAEPGDKMTGSLSGGGERLVIKVSSNGRRTYTATFRRC
jgi:hypothetical protein